MVHKNEESKLKPSLGPHSSSKYKRSSTGPAPAAEVASVCDRTSCAAEAEAALALPLPSPRHSLSISTKGTSQRNSVQEPPRQFTSTQQAQPPYLLHASTPLHQKPCFHHIHTQIPLFSI